MSFKQFDEFVKDKDKGKAPVKKIADYPGPVKNAPPGGGKPYAGGKGGKAKKGGKVGCDWTSKGDKSLVYKPKTDQGMPDKKAAKCVDSVKEFVDSTRGMSPVQFARYLSENSANAGEVHEAIHAASNLLARSPSRVGDLVAELRRKGLLPLLVQAAMTYGEGFDCLAGCMADNEVGAGFCRKLVRAMNEMVGPPMHNMGSPHHGTLDMGDHGLSGDPHDPHHNLDPHHPDNLTSHPDDDPDVGMGDEDMEDGDEDLDDDGMGMDGDHEHGMDHDADHDEFGIDDEDQDGMEPHQGLPAPHHHGAAVGLHRHHPAAPPIDPQRPSMMARMMARENASPAARNLLKALNS